MEDEARDILRSALAQEPARAGNRADAIRRRVEPLGGVELHLPARGAMREPPDLRDHSRHQRLVGDLASNTVN